MAGKKRSVLTERKVKRTINKLPPAEAKEVLNNLNTVTEQRAEVEVVKRPGMIIDGRKIPYTDKDLVKMFRTEIFTPDDTMKITYQGVSYQLLSGMEMCVPTVIKSEYERIKREMRGSLPSVKRDAGINVEVGAGSLNG